MDNNKEIRKINGLDNNKSFSVILPKNMCVDLGIGKGDYVRLWMENKKIFLEKVFTPND